MSLLKELMIYLSWVVVVLAAATIISAFCSSSYVEEGFKLKLKKEEAEEGEAMTKMMIMAPLPAALWLDLWLLPFTDLSSDLPS